MVCLPILNPHPDSLGSMLLTPATRHPPAAELFILDDVIEAAIKTDEFQALLGTIGAVPPQKGSLTAAWHVRMEGRPLLTVCASRLSWQTSTTSGRSHPR
jgi:hypothetical protein